MGFGGLLVALTAWVLATVSAAPSGGDDFGAGFAALGAFLVGTLGLFAIAFGLATLPSRAETPDARLTIRPRLRQLARAGLAAFGGSLVVPVGVAYLSALSAALTAWYLLVVLGAALVAISFLATTGEALLVRAGVLA